MNFLAQYITKWLVYLALISSLYFNYSQLMNSWDTKDKLDVAIEDRDRAIKDMDDAKEELLVATKKINELKTKNKLCKLNAQEKEETSLIERMFSDQIKEIFHEQNSSNNSNHNSNHVPRMYF